MRYQYTAHVKPHWSAQGDVEARSMKEAENIIQRLGSLEARVPKDKVKVEIKEVAENVAKGA